MRLRCLLLLATIACLPAVRAAGPADSELVAGLQACEINGLHACLAAWYPDAPDTAGRLEAKMRDATSDLGGVTGTEVIFSRALSRQVQRYYIAIYFERRPLWVRLDRYAVGVKTVSLPLEFSLKPGDILPEGVTGR